MEKIDPFLTKHLDASIIAAAQRMAEHEGSDLNAIVKKAVSAYVDDMQGSLDNRFLQEASRSFSEHSTLYQKLAE